MNGGYCITKVHASGAHVVDGVTGALVKGRGEDVDSTHDEVATTDPQSIDHDS